MASSYAERLKARRGGGIKKKKPKELKLNATKKIRGKTVYWNPYTKSWSKTKVVRKVEVKKEKPKTRAEKLKDGMATWNTNTGNKAKGAELPGSKMVPKTEIETKESYKPRAEAKVIKDKNKKTENTPKEAYKPRAEAKVIKDKQTLKVKPKRFISDPKNKGRKYSVRTAQGKKLANKLKARARAQEMARKRKEKKKV